MVQNAQKYDWPSLHDHKRNKTIHIGDFVTKIDSQEILQDLSKFLWIKWGASLYCRMVTHPTLVSRWKFLVSNLEFK